MENSLEEFEELKRKEQEEIEEGKKAILEEEQRMKDEIEQRKLEIEEKERNQKELNENKEHRIKEIDKFIKKFRTVSNTISKEQKRRTELRNKIDENNELEKTLEDSLSELKEKKEMLEKKYREGSITEEEEVEYEACKNYINNIIISSRRINKEIKDDEFKINSNEKFSEFSDKDLEKVKINADIAISRGNLAKTLIVNSKSIDEGIKLKEFKTIKKEVTGKIEIEEEVQGVTPDDLEKYKNGTKNYKKADERITPENLEEYKKLVKKEEAIKNDKPEAYKKVDGITVDEFKKLKKEKDEKQENDREELYNSLNDMVDDAKLEEYVKIEDENPPRIVFTDKYEEIINFETNEETGNYLYIKDDIEILDELYKLLDERGEIERKSAKPVEKSNWFKNKGLQAMNAVEKMINKNKINKYLEKNEKELLGIIENYIPDYSSECMNYENIKVEDIVEVLDVLENELELVNKSKAKEVLESDGFKATIQDMNDRIIEYINKYKENSKKYSIDEEKDVVSIREELTEEEEDKLKGLSINFIENAEEYEVVDGEVVILDKDEEAKRREFLKKNPEFEKYEINEQGKVIVKKTTEQKISIEEEQEEEIEKEINDFYDAVSRVGYSKAKKELIERKLEGLIEEKKIGYCELSGKEVEEFTESDRKVIEKWVIKEAKESIEKIDPFANVYDVSEQTIDDEEQSRDEDDGR